MRSGGVLQESPPRAQLKTKSKSNKARCVPTCSIRSLKSSPPSHGLAAANRPGCTCGKERRERRRSGQLSCSLWPALAFPPSEAQAGSKHSGQPLPCPPYYPLPGPQTNNTFSHPDLPKAYQNRHTRCILHHNQSSDTAYWLPAWTHRGCVEQAAVAGPLPVTHVVAEDAAGTLREQQGTAIWSNQGAGGACQMGA